MRTKVCARCKQEKPWDEYHPRERTESGHVLRIQPYCKPCATIVRREWSQKNRERLRVVEREGRKARKMLRPESAKATLERQRRWRQRRREDPEYRERERRRQREYRARKWREDPEYRARELARKRDAYARKHGRRKRSHLDRPSKPSTRYHMLPIEPFREWLRDYIEQNRQVTTTNRVTESGIESVYDSVAYALGHENRGAAHRAVYRWLSESQMIPLDIADALVTRLDSPARLYELWPELAEVEAA